MNLYSKFLMLTAVALMMIPVGCEDSSLLNQNNTNTVSTGNFWANASDAALAVNGMYHPITNTFFWGRILHTGAILRSDIYNVRPFGPNTAMSTFQGEAGSARWSTEIWQEPFKTIFRANNIIENVSAENVPDETQRNGYLGQAYFMRGFSYWYLVTLYGNVPLVTETATDGEDFFPNQSAPAEVWAQVEADMMRAEDLLPSSWVDADVGRPTSGSATGMLGKSLLYQMKWSEAEAAFKKIIDSGQYALLPSEQYMDNFTQTNENNVESIYELQFLGQAAFAWGVDIPGTGNMGNFHIDYAPPTKSPDQSHYINSWVKDLFEANGETIRRDATIAYDYEGSTGYGGVPFTEDFADDIILASNEGMEPIYSRKYAGMDIGKRADVDFLGTNVGNNWRIIRYADVLLMAAEAMNEQGKTSEAEELLNQVRSRALVDTKSGLTQDEMRQALIEERVLELSGESHRFLDLVRWGLADDYMGETSLHGDHPKSLSGGVFQSGKHEYVWIPVSEITANDNIVQNPGY